MHLKAYAVCSQTTVVIFKVTNADSTQVLLNQKPERRKEGKKRILLPVLVSPPGDSREPLA
jgi:hypothetical protein